MRNFKDVEILLENYKKEPSLRLCNRIALALYPYMIKVSRENVFFNVHYETHERASINIDDMVNQLYLITIKCIQKSINHPTPIPYLLSSIKHWCKHIITTEHRRPHGMTECWNDKFDTLNVTVVDNLALGIVLNKQIEEEDSYKMVYNAILNLPESCRTIAVLAFVYGESQVDIARKIKKTKAVVHYQLKVAKKILTNYLKNKVDLQLDDRGTKALAKEARRLRKLGVSLYFLQTRYGLTSGQLGRLLYNKDLKTSLF